MTASDFGKRTGKAKMMHPIVRCRAGLGKDLEKVLRSCKASAQIDVRGWAAKGLVPQATPGKVKSGSLKTDSLGEGERKWRA